MSVSGVQLAKGIGVRPAKGFWADAWSTVLARRSAVLAISWLGVVAFFGIYAPILASGHPLWASGPDVESGRSSVSPLFANLSAIDLALLVWTTLGLGYVFVGSRSGRAPRAGAVLGGLVVAVGVVALASIVYGWMERSAQETARAIQTEATRTGKPLAGLVFEPFVRKDFAGYVVGGVLGAIAIGCTMLVPIGRPGNRLIIALLAAVLATVCVGSRWVSKLERWDYQQQVADGRLTGATYTLIPWSPFQRFSELSRLEPGSSRWRGVIEQATRSLPANGPLTATQIGEVGPALSASLAGAPEQTRAEAIKRLGELGALGPTPTRADLRDHLDAPLSPNFRFGTDKDGADVLTQLLHACRLSISIGLVSTGVALMIGVTIGALMGYFGGWVDLVLYRVVEVFMAVPVLFLLIVSVAVLPEELKTTYFMMAIIGCFTWTGMARFTRAEFLKLRNQDFVQSAQAVGVPLGSILFKHMLPNGVAPVLVDTSFAIAAAISVEATLSYLGLGPVDAASWGKLLSSAISSEGEFKWWLAVFPGVAIFLTVLSYNLLGEALRDAIDPRLKKARV